MPWSGMNAGMLSTLAGLGGLAQGYGQGQDQSLQRALLMQKLQEQQKQDQLKQQLAAALFGAGARQPLAPVSGGMPQQPGAGMPGAGGSAGFGSGMPGGGLPMAPQQQQPPQPNQQAMQIAALSQALGGGQQAPQMRSPQSMGGGMMGQIPGRGTPQREGLVDLLIRDESGGRNINQQVVPAAGGYNPSTGSITGPSSASGLGQMIDSTWRGTPTAQQTGYRRAIDAPEGVQKEAINDQIDKRGLADWAPYNKKFASDAKAYLGGLDLPAGGAQQAQTAANQVMNTTPMSAAGSMTLDSLVDSINQRMPNASPEVKLAAMQMLTPLMAEQAKTEWDHHKFNVQQQRIGAEDTETQRHNKAMEAKQPAADTQILTDPSNNNAPYVYDKTKRQATTLAGAPYTPGGAQKLGGRQPDGNSLMTDEEAKLAAEQYMAGDRTAVQGWGRGAQGDSNRVKIRKSITDIAKAKGLSGRDIAASIAEFEGTKAGERTLGTREASLGMALAEAEQFAPLALDASEKVDRTQFPSINSLLIAGERGTGDENVVRLAVAVKSIAAAYSLVLTRGGVPTDAARNQANEILDTAYSKGQLATAIDQMMKEIRAAKASPGQVRGQMREGITGQPQGPSRDLGGNVAPTKLDGDGNPIP